MTPEEIVAERAFRFFFPSADETKSYFRAVDYEPLAGLLLAALREAGYRIVKQRVSHYRWEDAKPEWVDVEDGAQ